jgi:hypothetical protein
MIDLGLIKRRDEAIDEYVNELLGYGQPRENIFVTHLIETEERLRSRVSVITGESVLYAVIVDVWDASKDPYEFGYQAASREGPYEGVTETPPNPFPEDADNHERWSQGFSDGLDGMLAEEDIIRWNNGEDDDS